jgi:hypothetical protein
MPTITSKKKATSASRKPATEKKKPVAKVSIAKTKLEGKLKKIFELTGYYYSYGKRSWRFSTGIIPGQPPEISVNVTVTKSEWDKLQQNKLSIRRKPFAAYIAQIPTKIDGFAIKVGTIGEIKTQRLPKAKASS